MRTMMVSVTYHDGAGIELGLRAAAARSHEGN
jgi:hypothetical protein